MELITRFLVKIPWVQNTLTIGFFPFSLYSGAPLYAYTVQKSHVNTAEIELLQMLDIANLWIGSEYSYYLDPQAAKSNRFGVLSIETSACVWKLLLLLAAFYEASFGRLGWNAINYLWFYVGQAWTWLWVCELNTLCLIIELSLVTFIKAPKVNSFIPNFALLNWQSGDTCWTSFAFL